ncbi:hypothetical protein D3C72_2151890 [compost metagenome]
MDAKPGADTPTTMGMPPDLAMTREAISSDSEKSSFGASPSWPSTVRPVEPQAW